jgi:hypothetical protein
MATNKGFPVVPEREAVTDVDVSDGTKKGGKKSAAARRRAVRQRLWPEVADGELWLRTRSVGFTTIPRTLPLINKILDRSAGKGMPVASTYLALWCRVFDEAFVEIRSQKDLAFESGFGGPRAEATWKARMKILAELGIISAKAGVRGEYQYVLMYNPLQVISRLYKEKMDDFDYLSLMDRMGQVGAEDIPT